MAVTRDITRSTQATLKDLGSGKPHYKYKPVSDVGDLLEGCRFFRDMVYKEVTTVQKQVVLVPKTTFKTETRRVKV